jgi:hypothetical protein
MIKGEKVLSYIKYYNEIESEYREKLAEAKRKADVREVFNYILLKFLSKIDNSIDQSYDEFIKFDGKSLNFESPLKEKIEKLAEKSDLHAIIERIFEAAKNRYLKLENDENTDYFYLKK